MVQKCQCGKHKLYNIPGETEPICCVRCKTDGMIDVKNKRCRCDKRPVYNVPGRKTAVACKDCKTDDMVDVVHKKCSCGKTPYFNIPGQTKGISCSKCKTGEMTDVVHKRCPCGSISPNFNMPGQTKGVCCSKCKTDEMIDIVSKRCRCGKKPVYNVPGGSKGVCCLNCKTDEMIDVMNKFCPGYDRPCPVRTQVYRGHRYCISCDPDDDRQKRYKMFEEAFFTYIKDKIDVHKREFTVTFDPTETANKFARLDGIVFGDGIIVCLEVDENGHSNYECDEHRMHLVTAELLQKYPEHVVSWVRVNPTVGVKNEWSGPSKKKREKLFDEVVTVVNDILKTRDTRIVYLNSKLRSYQHRHYV